MQLDFVIRPAGIRLVRGRSSKLVCIGNAVRIVNVAVPVVRVMFITFVHDTVTLGAINAVAILILIVIPIPLTIDIIPTITATALTKHTTCDSLRIARRNNAVPIQTVDRAIEIQPSPTITPVHSTSSREATAALADMAATAAHS